MCATGRDAGGGPQGCSNWRRNLMRRPRWMAAGASPLTSCSAGDGGGEEPESGGGGDAGKTASAVITVFGSEPERPLVPGDTNETGGGKIIDAMFTGLMEYDPASGEP